MQKLPAFILGGLLGLAAAVVPSCSPAPHCTVANCNGCCTADGMCMRGDAPTACGVRGKLCDKCVGAQNCIAGTCSGGEGGGTAGSGTGGFNNAGGLGGAPGGGPGGGTGTGGGVASCGPSSCPTGCCSQGQCLIGTAQSNSACGSGGFPCLPCMGANTCVQGSCTGGPSCDSTSCAGCCNGTTCVNAIGPGACGANGSMCMVCPSGQACQNGACVTPANVGGTCTSAAQCASLGAGAYCKTKTSTQNGTYQNGYCTVPCTLGGALCGAGTGVCVGGANTILSIYGENDLFCGAICPVPGTQSTCRTGYTCRNGPGGNGFCWISPTPPFDGGGSADKLGIPCTLTSQCANPPGLDWAYCIPATSSTGTATGWTNGYCSADCTYDNTGAFCGALGACLGFDDGAGGVVGLCMRTCPNPGGGRSTLRAGGAYVCATATAPDGGMVGYLTPACDQPGFGACPTRTYCNAANGYCCDGGFCYK